jgi:prepilin-type N-terminal cleavage/methylation domain-containing protein
MLRIKVRTKKPGLIPGNNKGFTLLEVLISVVILAVIITPILAVFTSSFRTTVVSQNLLDGAYIAQDVYENLVASDYPTLLATSSSKFLYDSDGDGSDDCYIKRVLYPDGVQSDLTSVTNPSYLHINVIGEQIKLFGASGTNDTANYGTQVTSISNITLSNSIYSSTVTVQVGTNPAMTFDKKYPDSPIVVVANIYNKKVSTPTVALTLSGDTTDIAIAEYARKSNFDEFTCTQLSSSNIFYGINDHSTTLVHAVVEVFDIEDSDKRIGFVEGTFEVSLS